MNLVRGTGAPGRGACWLSTLHYFTRTDDSWTDQAPNARISPLIRHLMLFLNDLCGDNREREALIGPHLFTPCGTAADMGTEVRRAEKVLYLASCGLAPYYLSRAVALTGLRLDTGPFYLPPEMPVTALERQRIMDLILELCSMGAKAEVVPTKTRAEVLDMLERPMEPKPPRQEPTAFTHYMDLVAATQGLYSGVPVGYSTLTYMLTGTNAG